MQGLRLATTEPNEEEKFVCSGRAWSASLAASRMENYAEIFGGFVASSVPVLVLPEAVDGFKGELEGSRCAGLNYLEIFGVLDAGTFSLSFEELLSMEKMSKAEDEEDGRFFEGTVVGQVETGPSELSVEVPVGGHIMISKVNQTSWSFHSNFDKEQLNLVDKTSQESIVKEVRNTICASRPQVNCGPDMEAETASPTGFVKEVCSRNVENDHTLSGCMEEENEATEQSEIFHRCLAGASVDGSENDLIDAHKPPSNGAAYYLEQHSPSSSYHSTASGDISFSDYAFLTISDINLHTQPLKEPPPLRAPPKLDTKQGMPKCEALGASNITFNRSYQAQHVGDSRTRHPVKEAVKNTFPIYSNIDVDDNKAAGVSAAAMIEAMEQAQASLKSAKELMARNSDSPHSDGRLGPHDFCFWNEKAIIFSGDSKHKTKMAQKVVPNRVGRETSVCFEDAEEAIRGKESRCYKLLDEKERSQEWNIDAQLYKLASSEKLIRTRVINGECYNSKEDIKLVHRLNAYQRFPEKESCGSQGQRFLQCDDDDEDLNKAEKFNTFRITENKMCSGGEFQMKDGNTKKLKSGIIINKEVMNIFETSARDVDDKEKILQTLKVSSDNIKKLVDPISSIQHDRHETELKHCLESAICAEETNNADGDTEPYACERNGSNLIGFCMDRKPDKFNGGEALGETQENVKETHLYSSNVEEISDASVVFEYGPLKSDEFDTDKNFKEAKLSSLQNAIEVELDAGYRTLFSFAETKMEATREECQLSMLKQTKTVALPCYNNGKDSGVEGIDNAFKQEKTSFIGIGKTSEQVKKQRAKWKKPNMSELNIAKPFVQPVCIEKAMETSKFQQIEEKNVFELIQKFENFEESLTVDGEQRNDEKKSLEKVQAALDLEKKIMGLNATQQVFQRISVQDSKATQLANSLDDKEIILSPSVDASKSSWKQTGKNIPDEWRDANILSKEILDSERKQEAEQKAKLVEEERVREREKDMIVVEKATRETYERVCAARERSENILLERLASETRHRPIRAYQDTMEITSAEVFERSEKVANEADMQAERAAVKRATAEVREPAIERAFSPQASHGARSHEKTPGNYSINKRWKHNETEGIVRPGNKVSVNNPKPTSDVNDAPIDLKFQSEGCEGESPIRCKARQERCQRMVERAAKALAEMNMRDLLAEREQTERNRLAESLDAEVKRWSSGKEGNLRALLSTLQYILGHDSGWQPISLTEVITAAAVRKVYKKAALYVHPDKLQQRGATIQHKYICEKVFDLLKDAWNKFNSEG